MGIEELTFESIPTLLIDLVGFSFCELRTHF